MKELDVESYSVPNPDNIYREVFDNGLTLLVRENHASPVSVIEGCLARGSIFDPAEKAGLSAFVSSMVMRGSQQYSFDEFNDVIESVGASLSVSSEDHITSFGATSLSEDFPTMVAILSDILQRPTFPREHVNRVRSQRLVRIQERDQDTQQVAGLRLYEQIFGNHPYGRATSGYTHTIGAIESDDLHRFHERYYSPEGAIIVVVGDVQTAAVADLVRSHFSSWNSRLPHDALASPVYSPATDRIVHPLPGKFQSDIMIGCPATERSHPDYYAIRVANTVVGRFGMMGRLGENVREEQGLAYYAYSTQDANLLGGVWTASAGVNPASVDQTIDSILHEFDRLASTLVPEEELSDSKAYLTGVVPLALETNEGVASTLLNMEWNKLGLDYLLRYDQLIRDITPEDVLRVANTYLRQEAATIVVAGLPEDIPIAPA